jgi:hypothetical protein
MRYIKTYEGTKSDINKKIEQANKLKQFIPGMYIVFYSELYDWKIRKPFGILILGRIGKIKKSVVHHNRFEDVVEPDLIEIDFIDLVSEKFQNNYEKNSNRVMSLEIFKKIYLITSSLTEANKIYEDAKIKESEEWELKNDAEKYNI